MSLPLQMAALPWQVPLNGVCGCKYLANYVVS